MSEKMTAEFPRFLVAAEKSGQGKTMLTCALLWLLKEQGMDVRAFKCGPDYIDPMFHRRVLGVPSYNLDSFFSSENEMNYLLGCHGKVAGRELPEHRESLEHREPGTKGREIQEHKGRGTKGQEIQEHRERGTKIAVVEGVMGFYDGLGGTTERASAYEVAKLTKTPVILVADASGRSLSVLAAIKGFLSYRPDNQIKGIIFNRLSPMLYPGLKKAAEAELGIQVLGYVPVIQDLSFESRHLGLILPEEIPEFKEKIKSLAEAIKPGIDLEALKNLAAQAEPVTWYSEPIPAVKKADGSASVIAVARDEAFCFYYQDNLDTLEAMGAKLLFFSPLHDEKIPDGADGLYLGGGYPELHARALSENISMRESIQAAIKNQMPCIAECGSFLYLKEWLEDMDGRRFPMCGLLPGGSRNAGKLKRFGYGTMTACVDGLLGEQGTKLPVHEFHHWDGEENGEAFLFEKPVGTRNWKCGYMTDSLYAGFPHLYFYGNFPVRYLRMAARWKTAIGKEA